MTPHRPPPTARTEAVTDVDRTPLCPWCNEPMESTGQYREWELDVGITHMEEVYECRDCDYDEHEQ